MRLENKSGRVWQDGGMEEGDTITAGVKGPKTSNLLYVHCFLYSPPTSGQNKVQKHMYC